MPTKSLILLLFLFTLGQSVDDQQKCQSESDQDSMEQSDIGDDDDPSFDVQSSAGESAEYDGSDGLETESVGGQDGGHACHQDGQSKILCVAEDHDELPDELTGLVEELAESDQLSAKRKKAVIDVKVAKMLGTTRTKMYEWKRELNLLAKKGKRPMNECEEQRNNLVKKFVRMTEEVYLAMKNLARQQGKKIPRRYTKQEKFDIVNRFMEIKEEYMAQTGPTTAMSCSELDTEIAREFELNKQTIYVWKAELGILERPNRVISKVEKEKIMREYKIRKKENPKITDAELSKIFGISINALRNMKKARKGRLGLPEIKSYSDNEKRALIRQFYKIKARNPEMSTREIERRLEIAHNSIWFWKKKFDSVKDNDVGTASANVMEDLSIYKGSLADKGDEIWRWNSATMRRRVN